MAASFFVRTQSAFVSNLEIGLSGLEARCRGSFARDNVREMDAALEGARRQRFDAEERRDRTAADEKRLRAAISDWQDKAAFAVGKNRPDLAERALAAQIEAEAKLAAAGEANAAASTEVQRIQTLMDEIQFQRSEMTARARTFAAKPGGKSGATSLSPEQRAEIARTNFDRMVEDLGEQSPPASGEADAAADLEELRRSDEIERRLDELKNVAGKVARKASKKI